MADTAGEPRYSRLLVVDDDQGQLRTLKDILRTEGFDVIGCSTGTQALEHLHGDGVGVALVDLRLPDMNGIEVLHRLRAVSDQVQVVIHTGHASYESAKNAVNLGAYAYVEKGGHPGELIDAVRGAFAARLRGYAVELESAVAERTRELQSANEELRRSEEKFRTLFNQAKDYIFIHKRSPTGLPVIVDANESACRIHGYTRDELIGKSIMELDVHLDEQRVREVMERLMSGEAETFETAHRRKDGTTFPAEVSASLLSIPGKPPLVIAIERDITERKRAEKALQASEEKHRQIVETANEGIWVLDAQANTQLANPRLAEMLGYSVEEMLDKPLMFFLDDEMQAEARQRLKRRAQGITEQFDFRFRRKDETDLWAIVSITPIHDDQGQYAGELGMITDVTEWRLLEEQPGMPTRWRPSGNWLLGWLTSSTTCCSESSAVRN